MPGTRGGSASDREHTLIREGHTGQHSPSALWKEASNGSVKKDVHEVLSDPAEGTKRALVTAQRQQGRGAEPGL